MENVKQVILWEPKRAEKRNASGAIVEGEFVGKFRTKVPEGTKNAIRHTGKNDADVEWDYWGLDVDSINGYIRWVDIRATDYKTKIVLFLETPKYLHQITVPYDVNNLHKIGNHLLGLGKEVATAFINVSYWVRKKKDKDGKVKVDKKGKVMWARDLWFEDVPEFFTFDEWKKFAEESGLQWFQEVRKGETEWNFEAELKFWEEKIANVQKFLLTTPDVLPFSYNSITLPTLGQEAVDTAADIYQRVKGRYRFPFGRNSENADDMDYGVEAAPAPAPQPAETERTAHAAPAGRPPSNARPVSVPNNANFPTEEPDDIDKLPF